MTNAVAQVVTAFGIILLIVFGVTNVLSPIPFPLKFWESWITNRKTFLAIETLTAVALALLLGLGIHLQRIGAQLQLVEEQRERNAVLVAAETTESSAAARIAYAQGVACLRSSEQGRCFRDLGQMIDSSSFELDDKRAAKRVLYVLMEHE